MDVIPPKTKGLYSWTTKHINNKAVQLEAIREPISISSEGIVVPERR